MKTLNNGFFFWVFCSKKGNTIFEEGLLANLQSFRVSQNVYNMSRESTVPNAKVRTLLKLVEMLD